MHTICYALLCAIHVAVAAFALRSGAWPEAVCAGLAALVYLVLALAPEPRNPRSLNNS
jgi:hypothetical protein